MKNWFKDCKIYLRDFKINFFLNIKIKHHKLLLLNESS
jgi:hypothetical protein